jgi:hypothetical protein
MNQDFWSMLNLLVPVLTGVSSQVTQGLGAAGGAQAQTIAAQSNTADMLSAIGSIIPF